MNTFFNAEERGKVFAFLTDLGMDEDDVSNLVWKVPKAQILKRMPYLLEVVL